MEVGDNYKADGSIESGSDWSEQSETEYDSDDDNETEYGLS